MEIGNGVKELPNNVFATGNKLISLTIGSAVLSINSNAFSSKPIKTIWLTNTPPEGYTQANGKVNYVANELYKYLSKTTVYPFLSSLFEVNGVKYVPVSPSDRTCDAIDCTYDKSVEKINIGKTVTFKGVEMAVKGVKHYTCYKNSYINGATLSFEGDLGDYAFSNCTALTTATLGSKITSIGKDAFYNCSSLQEITIPNAVKSLGEYAFYGCSGMTSAKIGNGITAINKSTVSGCSALKDIQIGTGVMTIDTYSFSRCSSLPMIEIPKNVTDIKDYVFQSCSQLKNVNIADREEVLNLGSNDSSPLFAHCPLEEVYIGGNISYSTGSNKGYSPFYRNTSLQTVTITDKETEISPNEFYGCTSLKNVSIGDGVTTIGNWAFSGCSSLENFSYGSMVNSIGQEAFSDCTAMTKLVSHAATPPVCGSQALDDINKWACTLSVPKGATASYQAADQWKEFFFINDELEIATLLGDANGDGVVNVTDIVSVVNIILSDPVAARELLGDDEEDE
ncbi:MAG: leucine-rich repeat protein [Prevotella sp.]|nr:leucine-rich repeat protein [Prevotella sp.]